MDFQGQTRLNLDAKFRFVMPMRHRELLNLEANRTLVITRHPDGCLMLFPAANWLKFKEKLLSLPIRAQWWKRIFLGSAAEVEMDKNGRILIAPELRNSAKLQKEIVLMGVGKFFEIWDAATYDEKESNFVSTEQMPEVLDFSF